MSDDPHPFEWRQFLTLAQRLGASDGEAELRSAVSRAYYAVFHAALRHVHDCDGVRLGRHDIHTALWRHFDPRGQCPGLTRAHRRIGRDGARLRELRNQADYDDKPLKTEDLRLAISRAEHLLNALAELTHKRSAAAKPPTSPF